MSSSYIYKLGHCLQNVCADPGSSVRELILFVEGEIILVLVILYTKVTYNVNFISLKFQLGGLDSPIPNHWPPLDSRIPNGTL